MRSIADRIQKILARFPAGGDSGRVLVAYSGGPDSTFLVHRLAASTSAGIAITLGHVHHGLRGSAADADLELCRTTAHKLRLELLVAHLSPPARPTEAWAREARYSALREMARSSACAAVLTAHHLDDQIETILLKLLRGCRPSRARGMAAVRRLRRGEELLLIRPLLDREPAIMRRWLRRQEIPFAEDATNQLLETARNRLRHEVIPLLDRIAPPGWKRRWASLFAHLARRARSGEREAEQALLAILLQGAGLVPTRARRARLRRGLRGAAQGTLLGTRVGFRIERRGERVQVVPPPRVPEPFQVSLLMDGVVRSPAGRLSCRILARHQARSALEEIRRDATRRRAILAIPDRHPGHPPNLEWRRVRALDRMHPLGAPRSRRVRRILASRGCPREERAAASAVCFEGRIAWLVEAAIDQSFRLRPERPGETPHLLIELSWQPAWAPGALSPPGDAW